VAAVHRWLRVAVFVAGSAAAACEKASTVSPEPRDAGPGRANEEGVLAIADDDEVPFPPRTEPAPAVKLPPPPAFPRADAPEQYPDGSYSIRGLRSQIDSRVEEGEAGTEIVVTAWVQEIYVAPPCPKDDVCPPPRQPHLWVADSRDEQGKKRAMLVANWAFIIPEFEAKRWKGQPKVVLEKGKRYRIKGKFKRFSDSGFAHSAGLLEFVAYERVDARGKKTWVYPPGAPWHPLVAADVR
jgi:hypothetical protein